MLDPIGIECRGEASVKRREFIVGLCAAGALPLVAHAQQSSRPLIGFLSSRSLIGSSSSSAAFKDALSGVCRGAESWD